jgi:hypothetical protein
MTQLLRSGLPGTKINLVIVGDGFANGDQTLYNDQASGMASISRRNWAGERWPCRSISQLSL